MSEQASFQEVNMRQVEHEKNHLEMHICEALDINPYSEEAAILSGETAMQILNEALYNIAEL